MGGWLATVVSIEVWQRAGEGGEIASLLVSRFLRVDSEASLQPPSLQVRLLASNLEACVLLKL